MMKAILRYIIALIFIASGFVKAVDTVGFSFKLEEYFSPSVFNMPFMEKFALVIAAFVSGLEIVLGVMLLMKIQLRKTLASLIALCVFFAFLTFYSAYFNVVTDCGCFGDALKMTPWQSFWKDILLLAGLIGLWLAYKNSGTFEKHAGRIKSPILWMTVFLTTFIICWGIKNEPLVDFRDYKIGTDIRLEKQKIEQNPSEYKTFYILKNKSTGEERKVSSDDFVSDKKFWEQGTPWEIQKDKTTSEIMKKGYESEISKFRIDDKKGNDITSQILNAQEAVLVFSYKPQALTNEEIQNAENAVSGKPFVYGVSTNPNTFTRIPNVTMDGTAIKTIARSNPFILVLNKGKIVEKIPAQDFR
ncbi:DoxX family protein [Chryseobacterium taklimakanense]|uniref:BT_3928 family protein n=1 Tax=Chryseobacterium taklimakanense TaxID=536441 RepID=UPI000F5F9EE0|nr:BT_3928 family protein [Chryseobacterium taklimakanense]AZI22401.1 DoxX family protein [Chryseobacterium taklimakanense]